jgi:hypothetical protein
MLMTDNELYLLLRFAIHVGHCFFTVERDLTVVIK